MASCARCRKAWPSHLGVCPEDGAALVDLHSGATAELPMPLVPLVPPIEPDLAPNTRIGEYRVEGKLGEGGMASVFSATHPLIGKKVAIKVISRRLCNDAHAVERFVGEARAVNQIGHPNIVDIFACGVLPDGRAYLVMEWLQGETLEQRLQKGPVPPAFGIDVLLQVCEALEAVHEQKIMHRDVKPANIYLVERKERTQVKLLDFGIAKLADSDVTVPKTRSGVAMGTAGYMSPEQARNKNVDHRTDIYALAAVGYEVLLGRLPFWADSAVDILAMHLAAPPPTPRSLWPDIPSALEKLLLRMLAKEPDERPALIEVRDTLRTVQAALASGEPLAGERGPRRGLWMTVGALATVCAVAGGWGWRHRVRPATPPPAPAPASAVPTSAGLPFDARPHETHEAAASAGAPAPARNDGSGEHSAMLIIHATPSNARVRVDGRAYSGDADGVRVRVAEGEHVVTVTAPHRATIEQPVRVAAGTTAEVGVVLPAPRPSAKKKAGPHDGDYTLNPF